MKTTTHLRSSSEGSSLSSCRAQRTAQGALPSLTFFCRALFKADKAPRHRPSGGRGVRLLSKAVQRHQDMVFKHFAEVSAHNLKGLSPETAIDESYLKSMSIMLLTTASALILCPFLPGLSHDTRPPSQDLTLVCRTIILLDADETLEEETRADHFTAGRSWGASIGAPERYGIT